MDMKKSAIISFYCCTFLFYFSSWITRKDEENRTDDVH